jgi:hypothetical protein
MLNARSSYLDSAKRLEAYLTTEWLPREPEGIRAFLVTVRDRTKPTSAAKHYRNLRVYFRWPLTLGRDRGRHPMARFEKPHIEEIEKP